MNVLNQVKMLTVHPRALRGVTTVFMNTEPDIKFVLKLIAEYLANPVLDKRWDAIRDLRALIPASARQSDSATTSHAKAVKLLRAHADEDQRIRTLGRIMRVRYEDSPFMTGDDLLAALPHLPKQAPRAVAKYLWIMAMQLNRLQAAWERDALARRGTSIDDVRRRAADELRALEARLDARTIDDAEVRRELLGAFAATRSAPVDAQRHWRWLLAQGRPLHIVDANNAMAAARDAAALARVHTELVAARQRRGSAALEPSVCGLLVEHYVRVGRVDDAQRLVDDPAYPSNGAWAVAYARGEVPPRDSQVSVYVRKNIKRATLLEVIGFDFETVLYMLAPFSPYYWLLRGLTGHDRRRRYT